MININSSDTFGNAVADTVILAHDVRFHGIQERPESRRIVGTCELSEPFRLRVVWHLGRSAVALFTSPQAERRYRLQLFRDVHEIYRSVCTRSGSAAVISLMIINLVIIDLVIIDLVIIDLVIINSIARRIGFKVVSCVSAVICSTIRIHQVSSDCGMSTGSIISGGAVNSIINPDSSFVRITYNLFFFCTFHLFSSFLI